MTEQHTPGPWRKFKYKPSDDDLGVEGADGYTLAEDLSLADANLIAAAPDLLEALQMCLAVVKPPQNCIPWDYARAAIAKATGAAP